jgi:monothiol glutaredoxin
LYVNGEFVGGCDIVMNMHKSGELERVLESADVLVPFDELGESMESGDNGENAGRKKSDVKKAD